MYVEVCVGKWITCVMYVVSSVEVRCAECGNGNCVGE